MRRLLEKLGSWKAGVALLILIAAASAAGTLIAQDPLHAPGSVHRTLGGFLQWMFDLHDLFHSGLYLGLLFLLALNVLSSTLATFSLRPAKLGGLAAHLGILLVLLGGFLYLLRGEKGVIDFAEGDTADKYLSRRDGLYKPLPFAIRLDRFVADYYPSKLLLIGPEGSAVSVTPREGDNVTLPWTTARVTVEKIVHNAARVTTVIDDNGPLNPAAHFKVGTEGGELDVWRFAHRESLVETLLRADGRIALAFDNENIAQTEDGWRLFAFNIETGQAFELPCNEFTIPGTTPPATGQVLEMLDDADNTPLGPGLRIEIESGEKIGQRRAYARLPFFDPDFMPGREIVLPNFLFVYYRPKVVLDVTRVPWYGAPFSVQQWIHMERDVSKAPDEVYYYLDYRAGPLRGGQRLSIGNTAEVAGVKLTLLGVVDHARIVTRYEPSNARTGSDAVLVKVDWPAGPPREVWLSTTGSDRVVPLADALTLAYVASDDVREYRSEVTLDDKSPATIRVNHPVSCKGWQIFQEAGSTDSTPPVSRLVVSRDPGLPFVIVGFALLVLGVFWSAFVRRGSKVAE